MPKPNVTALGETLRRHRIAARLSQHEVAAKCGMSQKKYSQIEQGNVRDPGIGDTVEIGRVLGFTPNDIAEVAELWAPIRKQDLRVDARWEFVQAFLTRADKRTRDKALDMMYASALAVQRYPDIAS
jgi:transcriptional regulator with XRE-family HTH domain